MQIKITTDQVNGVADSLCKYIQKDLVESDKRLNMFWYCGSLNLVQRLQKETESSSDSEYVSIQVDDRLVSDIQEIIEKYIFEEIKELGTDDREWMMEMANLYLQLAAESKKETEKKTPARTETKKEVSEQVAETQKKEITPDKPSQKKDPKSKKINIF